jgi:hypothetical protein
MEDVMASAREIDWATAAVDAGTLRVALTGDAPRGWQGRFKAVVRLLDQPGGRWGTITISGGLITVRDVTEGVESDLRYLLEGVVQQANADLGLKREDDAEREPSAQQRRRAADREMSSHFRAFAEPPG